MLMPLEMPNSLLWPSVLHLGLTAFLYLWLTFERGLGVVRGRQRYSDYILASGDTGRGARVAANLRNQFEAPPFFHMLILALVLAGTPLQGHLILAWVFVLGRGIHTLVQALFANVVLRGLVFSINFLALCGMWGLFFWQMFGAAQP